MRTAALQSRAQTGMTSRLLSSNRSRHVLSISSVLCLVLSLAIAQSKNVSAQEATSACRIEAKNYKGWQAQQVSNRWVQLMVVPQNGGRLMQVTFAGHPYLFVNPKYEGKYFPPASGPWFNYGGDKLWPLPEGNNDEQHWTGGSDLLDDGPYTFRKVSEGQTCELSLDGPADPRTGIQFLRTIRLDSDSPRIRFHATMKNTTGHALEWSMQSVSQYDASDGGNRSRINGDLHAFAPANPASGYLNRYHVRFGPAENPSSSIRADGMFSLHYVHMAAELWLDSTAGWLAVVDGSSRYGMVERFQFQEARAYPGKASIIFWTNGPELKLNADGEASLTSGDDGSPYYMEAEINSPLCRLRPGEMCDLDTEWFPTRVDGGLQAVTDAGIVVRGLQANLQDESRVKLYGSFGVFFPGRLVAHVYGEHGAELKSVVLMDVDPSELVSLETEITASGKPTRISLHLEDRNGVDRGALQEVQVGVRENR
jgi:hypothetical protein